MKSGIEEIVLSCGGISHSQIQLPQVFLYKGGVDLRGVVFSYKTLHYSEITATAKKGWPHIEANPLYILRVFV